MSVKQVIVIRKDLNMRKGKCVAQGAHASMAAILQHGFRTSHQHIISMTPAMKEWLNGSFVKVCVGVDSEQELIDLYTKAEEENISRAMITDEGRTEFNGVPTKTAIALGPADSDELDKITGHLKLL